MLTIKKMGSRGKICSPRFHVVTPRPPCTLTKAKRSSRKRNMLTNVNFRLICDADGWKLRCIKSDTSVSWKMMHLCGLHVWFCRLGCEMSPPWKRRIGCDVRQINIPFLTQTEKVFDYSKKLCDCTLFRMDDELHHILKADSVATDEIMPLWSMDVCKCFWVAPLPIQRDGCVK